MNENSNKKTNNTFLLLSVFGILFVVLGHCKSISVFLNNVFPYYSFHMALFAFISGYFFKDRSLKDFLKVKIKKLIIPYFCWNIIYGIIVNILKALKIVNAGKQLSLYYLFVAPFLDSGNHYGLNVAAWFVISIFFVQLVYFIVYKITKKIKINNDVIFLIISVVIAFFEVKYVQNGHNYGLYYLLTRVCFLLPFYYVGRIYKRYEDKIKINGKYTCLFFMISIIIQTLLLAFFKNISYNLQLLRLNSNYIVYFIGSLNGIFFWLKISKILSKYIKNNYIIDCIGNNTYSIMMHHVFAIFLFNSLIYIVHIITGLFKSFDVATYQSKYFYFYNSNPGLTVIYVIISVSLPLIGNYFYKKIKGKIINKCLLFKKKANSC